MRERVAWLTLVVSCVRCGNDEARAPADAFRDLEPAYLEFSTRDNDFNSSCFHLATPVAAGYPSRRAFCLARLEAAAESAAELRRRVAEAAGARGIELASLNAAIDAYSETVGTIASRIRRGEFSFEDADGHRPAVFTAWEESLSRFDALLKDLVARRLLIHAEVDGLRASVSSRER